MKTKIVITDLTRMQQGRVCIAGYDKDRHCIRPTLPPPGISEQALYNEQNQPIIYPFALLELDLVEPTPKPPHTEDCRFDPASLRFVRQVKDRKAVLDWSLYETVEAIFEQPIHSESGFYVMECQGPRSLGTIQSKTVVKILYEQDIRGAWDYRLHFYDGNDKFYRLKIVDLTWQYYCHSLRGPDSTPADIAVELTKQLKSKSVYLRLGLARGWQEHPDRCYLQITGIYTFPDHLDSKTFADFAPKAVRECPEIYMESSPI